MDYLGCGGYSLSAGRDRPTHGRGWGGCSGVMRKANVPDSGGGKKSAFFPGIDTVPVSGLKHDIESRGRILLWPECPDRPV